MSSTQRVRSRPAASERPKATRYGVLQADARTLHLVVPEPPSANRYWRHAAVRNRVVVYLSAEAKEYRVHLALLLRAPLMLASRRHTDRGDLPYFVGTGKRLTVALTWVAGRRGDVDNIPKVLLDALQGLAVRSDAQVRSLLVEYIAGPPGHGSVQIIITEDP